MKQKIFLSFIALFIGLFIISCGEEKAKPIQAEGFEKYEQPKTELTVNIPTNWKKFQSPENFLLEVYSDEKAKYHFNFNNLQAADYDAELPAAMIKITAIPLEMDMPEPEPAEEDNAKGKKGKDEEAKDTVKKEEPKELKDFNYYFNIKPRGQEAYSAPKNVKIDGVDAKMQTYELPIGFGYLEGEIYYVVNEDTLGGMLTVIEFEALAHSMKDYRATFDEVLKTVKLAKRPIEEKKAEPTDSIVVADPPSKERKTMQGTGFSIQIPQNFGKEPWNRSKGTSESFNYVGKRRGDCNILVDILSKKSTKSLEEVAKEIAKKVRGASNPKPKNLGGGTKGMVYAYVPAAKYKSQAYIAKKGDTIYRITVNWYTGKNPHTGEDEEPLFKDILLRCAETFTLQ